MTVDIAALEVADKVNRSAHAEYYSALLEGMKQEADRLGYRFVEGGASGPRCGLSRACRWQ